MYRQSLPEVEDEASTSKVRVNSISHKCLSKSHEIYYSNTGDSNWGHCKRVVAGVNIPRFSRFPDD